MSSESIPFEGVEKRLVVQFKREGLHHEEAGALRIEEGGLRFKSPYAMSASEWQQVLDEARCEIISCKEFTRCPGGAEKEEFDSAQTKVYLLSESTLVVWTDGFLLKTCGRTTPFVGFRKLLDLYGLKDANSTAIDQCPAINWIAYSRLDFLHPDYQVWPHRNFQEEQQYFAQHFATDYQAAALPAGGQKLYVLFFSPQQGPATQPGYAMEEVLMTNISEACVKDLTGYENRQEQLAQDVQQTHSVLAHALETKSPKHVLDEFWFDPCGYSANVLFEGAHGGVDYFSTHISPEPCTSYASLELGTRGHTSTFLRPEEFNLDALVQPFEAANLNVTRVIVQASHLNASAFAKGTLRRKALGNKESANDAVSTLTFPAFSCYVEHYAENDADTTASSSRNSLAEEAELSEMVFLVG